MTGRALIAPPARSWFTERELAAEAASLPKCSSQVPMTSGKGWEPPQLPKLLAKSVAIPLSCRG